MKVPCFLLLGYFLMVTLTLDDPYGNLTITDPHGPNLINKYGIEKCDIKHLPLGIYSLCMYLYPLHIPDKQSI